MQQYDCQRDKCFERRTKMEKYQKLNTNKLERVNGGNNFLLNALKIIPVPILFIPRKK